MIVYKPHADGFVQCVVPIPPESPVLTAAPGRRQLPGWTPAPVELLTRDQGRRLTAVDLPAVITRSFALNSRAKDVLVDVVGKDAELLPLACADEELWLLNPLHVTDALDEKRSELARYPSSGRIMGVVRPVFDPKKLGDHRYFLTRQNHFLYVTDVVVQAVRDAKLTGVRFEPVWSDEAPSA
jgi:hypothetical protein